MDGDELKVMNYQGRMINPLDLKKEDFNNIGMQCAVTLSRHQRFWGQSLISYTEAQHCLSMYELFKGDKELQKWGLAHKVYKSLTYMSIPSPLKHMDLYKPFLAAEEKAIKILAEKYNLTYPLPQTIKDADKALMVMEAEALMPISDDVNWRDYSEPAGMPYRLGATEEEVRKDFIEKWIELFGSL